MKDYTFLLSVIFLVFNVSALWESDTIVLYGNKMKTFVDAEIEKRQAELKGINCIEVDKIQLDDMMKNYGSQIGKCVIGVVDKAKAERCADDIVTETLKELDLTALEAQNCIKNAV